MFQKKKKTRKTKLPTRTELPGVQVYEVKDRVSKILCLQNRLNIKKKRRDQKDILLRVKSFV